MKTAVISNLFCFFKSDSSYRHIAKKIERNIKRKDIVCSTRNAIREVLGLVERVLTRSDNTTMAISSTLFNDEKALQSTYQVCVDALSEAKAWVIVILDKFDTILDLFKKPEEDRYFFHQTIATSLLELAYSEDVRKEEISGCLPNPHVLIKILFPEDLYSTLKPRDLQKYDQHAIELRWTKVALELFLAKRISRLIDMPIRKPEDKRIILQKMFNHTIFNTFYKRDENTVDYVLRHSLFKPRDIQELCTSIADQFIKKNSIESLREFKRRIPFDDDSIKEGVKRATIKLIDYLRIEFLSIDFESILSVLKHKPNIMKYGDLYNHLKATDIKCGELTIDELIRLLAKIGLIGRYLEGDQRIVETYRRKKLCKIDVKYYVALFSFSSERDIEFSQYDQVVIAPLFYDALDTKADEKRPIYPF